MNIDYFQEIRKLSLTARVGVALVVCERYFELNKLLHAETREFLDYLWEWPVVSDFDSWEKSRTDLVNYGLGDEISKAMTELLVRSEVNESNFRRVVAGTVEILWGSFWGAAEDEQSYESLVSVLNSSGLERNPVLTPFKFCTFDIADGWGPPVSSQDRDFWRKYASFA